MATGRAIKNRIKATKNIQQITKAMEAVSAVKMRKSEGAAVSARPYALASLNILKNIRKALKDETTSENPLVTERHVNRTCLVVITSDKGLAGAFNTNVIRKAQNFITNTKNPVDVVAIGKRGRDYFGRHKLNLIKEFSESGDFATIAETLHIAEYIHSLFAEMKCDEVVVVYTNFISALKQNVVVRKILPVTVEALEEITKHIAPDLKVIADEKNSDYTFEPSTKAVLEQLIPELVNVEIFQCILEANASEHSSRMIAMKSASDNAGELIGDLRIVYNKARQAQITKELTEITAGAEALSS